MITRIKWYLYGRRNFRNAVENCVNCRHPWNALEVLEHNVRLVYQNHPKILNEMIEMIRNAL